MEDESIGGTDVQKADTPAGRAGPSADRCSSLFLLRLWEENAVQDERSFAGRLIHVTSGRAHDFLDLPALNLLLVEMYGQSPDESSASGVGGDGPTL